MIHAYLADCQQNVQELLAPFYGEALSDLALRINKMTIDLVVIGDHAEAQSTEAQKGLGLGVHFHWMEEAKQVLVLWRDTLYQFQKARILQKEAQIGDEQIVSLHSSSQKILQEAVQTQEETFRELEQLLQHPKSGRKKIEEWSLLNSPWHIYKEQIEDLGRQPNVLLRQYENLLEVSSGMMTIDADVRSIFNKGRNGIDNILSLAQKSIDAVESTKDYKKLAFELEGIEQLIKPNANFDDYNERLDHELMDYNSILQFPIDTDSGIIKYKDLNPARDIRQWLEGEIHPSMNDAIEIMENASSAFKMALVNVRNRVLLFSQEDETQKAPEAEDLIQPLLDAIEDVRSWRSEYKSIRNTAIARLDNAFHVHQIYNQERSFLPLSYTVSLSQLKLEENPLVARVKNWIGEKTQVLQDVRSTVLREESLSDAERIIRYVKSRKIEEDHHQYDSIFTSEGYIGESFCTGRKQEIEHLVNLINDWRAGFRGAVILHGTRFCGKTLFGEMISQRYFHNDTISLKPNTTLSVLGRRIDLTDDLEEALEFISKYAREKKQLVWIDDLELWGHGDVGMDHSVSALLSHIDRFDSRFFYMVSMNSWAMTHYNEMFGLNHGLEASINLSRMALEEVKKAMAIRHGATHKRLIGKEEKEMTSSEFAKHATDIYRMSSGNIGESLRLWACVSHMINEEEVRIGSLPLFDLPDFVDADRGILLRTLLQKKQTNEYRLLKQFGPAFGKRYKVLIQRLLSYGILQRQGNGFLYIAPGVVNEVARILASHGHIQIPTAR